MTDSVPPRYRTSMSVAHDEGVRTYFALDQESGRPVLAHLFDVDTPDARAQVDAMVARLAPDDAALVIDRGMTERGWALITQPAEGLNLFAKWLANRVAAATTVRTPTPEVAIAPPIPTPEPVAVPAAKPPGEFTQMFMVPTLPVSPVPPARTTPPTPPMPSPVTPVPPAITPLPAAVTPLPAAETPVPPPFVPAPSAARPGEFTQMFMAPTLPPSSAPPALTQPPIMPPAYTPPAYAPPQGISSLPPLPPIDLPPAYTPLPPVTSSPVLAPPTYTPAPTPTPAPMITGASAMPPVLPPPLFDLPGVGGASGAGSVRPKSEYTSIINVPVLPPPPAVSAPVTNADATSGTKGRLSLPVILAINAIIIVTIALILYFVFRRPPTAVPTVPTVGADSLHRATDSSAHKADSAKPAR